MRWSSGYWLNYETNPSWHPCFCCYYYLEQSDPWNYFRYAKAVVMCLCLPLFLYKSGVRAAVWFQTRFYCPVPGRICQPLIVAVPTNADLPDCVRFGILKCFKQHLRRFDFCLADICPRRLSAAVWNARVALERRAIRRDRAEHPEELKKTRMSLEHSGQSFWIMHSDILLMFQQDFVYSKKKKIKPQISDLDLCYFSLQRSFTTFVYNLSFKERFLELS